MASKPTVTIHVFEAKDVLPPDPASYFRKYNKFTCFCKLDFQGWTKKTKEVNVEMDRTVAVWNEAIPFSVDTKQLSNEGGSIVTIEVIQKKESIFGTDNILGKMQVAIATLGDNLRYETWVRLGNGQIRIAITRLGLNEYLPPPPTQPLNAPPPQQPYQQYEHLSTGYQPSLQPPMYHSFPNEAPPPTNPELAYQPPNVPPPTPVNNAPVEPSIPLKTSLPEDITKKTVIANTSRALQQVTEKVLGDYFRFCGHIVHMKYESPLLIVSFERDYEADTAVLLDNGMVCGGPIQVFRIVEASSKILHSNPLRANLEKLVKQFAEEMEHKPRSDKVEKSEPSNPASDEGSEDEEEDLQAPRVYVTNISSKADASVVEDFFSYCGKVLKVELHKHTHDTQRAIVQFESQGAANMAMLLSGGFIQDKAIIVHVLHSDIENELKEEKPVSSSSNQTDKSPATENKSVSSVVAAMLAGGYQMGSNVIDKAKAYDRKKLNIGKSITNAKEKILQFDSHYEISKKVQKAGNEAKQAFLTGVKKLGDRKWFGNKEKEKEPTKPVEEKKEPVTGQLVFKED